MSLERRLRKIEQQQQKPEFEPFSTILRDTMGLKPGETVRVKSNLRHEHEILEAVKVAAK